MSDEALQAAAVMAVPFEIHNIAVDEEGLVAGFYFTIPMPDDEKVNPAEIPLDGPYETRQIAFEAARDFIKDCLTTHPKEN